MNYPLEPKKKAPRQKKLVPSLDKSTPLADRISVFGKQYPGSLEGDWCHKNGAGWVYATELGVFQELYFRCAIDENHYHRTGGMVMDYKGNYVHPKHDGHGWFLCAYSGSMWPDSKKVKVFDVNHDTVFVAGDMLNDATFKDFHTGDIFLRNCRMTVEITSASGAFSKVLISKHTFQNTTKFKSCGNCPTNWEADQIKIRTGFTDFGGICPRCLTTLENKNIILAHDSKDYPKPIYKCIRNLGSIVSRGRVVSTMTAVETPPIRLYGAEVELEICPDHVSRRTSIAKEIRKAIGPDFCVMKHDGSLHGTGGPAGLDGRGLNLGGQWGFEVVTAPACLATHRERWMKLTDIADYANLRAWDTGTCGFHVHISRDALSTLQIGRILTFVNYPANKLFIQKVAGRSEVKWSKYYPKGPMDSVRPDKGDHNERRRVAVNTQNPKTIEFRIFRGTVWPRHILRNLEFVDAMCEFCAPCTRAMRELLRAENFIAYVAGARTCNEKGESMVQWPLLLEWMVKAQMVAPVEKKAKDPRLITTITHEEESETAYIPPRRFEDNAKIIGINPDGLRLPTNSLRETKKTKLTIAEPSDTF